MREKTALLRRRALLLKKLARLKESLPGTLVWRYRKCGRKSCWCAAAEKGHPQLQLTRNLKGKVVTLAVPSSMEPEVDRQVKQYQELKGVLSDLFTLNEKLFILRKKERRHDLNRSP